MINQMEYLRNMVLETKNICALLSVSGEEHKKIMK